MFMWVFLNNEIALIIMYLPQTENLPINILASVFKSKVATYKYYWLLAIIELVEEGNIEIPKRKIFSKMISNSWYTINYFKLSFGKSDQLQNAVERILKAENLTIDEKKNNIEINYFILIKMYHIGFYRLGFQKITKKRIVNKKKESILIQNRL